VCPLALLNGVAQRDGDMRLPHQLIEILRPILPIEADIGHPATTRRILPNTMGGLRLAWLQQTEMPCLRNNYNLASFNTAGPAFGRAPKVSPTFKTSTLVGTANNLYGLTPPLIVGFKWVPIATIIRDAALIVDKTYVGATSRALTCRAARAAPEPCNQPQAYNYCYRSNKHQPSHHLTSIVWFVFSQKVSPSREIFFFLQIQAITKL